MFLPASFWMRSWRQTASPPPPPATLVRFPWLTHGAFGGDGHRLQEDLDDAGPDPRGGPVVSVQVVQDLLDDVVGVLSLESGGEGGGSEETFKRWEGSGNQDTPVLALFTYNDLNQQTLNRQVSSLNLENFETLNSIFLVKETESF